MKFAAVPRFRDSPNCLVRLVANDASGLGLDLPESAKFGFQLACVCVIHNLYSPGRASRTTSYRAQGFFLESNPMLFARY